VALCVFWLVEVLFGDLFLSAVTALLFVAHPIHTEAVSYISGRADPLASFFMLLCMIVYIKLLNSNRFNIAGYLFLLLTFACALLSKEYTLILPLCLLFTHFIFGKKIKPLEFGSLLGVAAGYLILRCTFFKSMMFSAGGTDTPLDRIPGMFVATLSYFKLIFLPFPLHMEYGAKLFDWFDPKAIMGLVLICGVLIFGYIKRNNKILLFCIGWFFLTFLPDANIYKINAYMAEHFIYIPSIGIFLALSYALSFLYNNKRYKPVAIFLVIISVLFFLVVTIRQNRYWRDPVTFYETTLKYAPHSANAYNNIGESYQTKGDLKAALSSFNKAIESNPNIPEAYNNRGSVYESMGNYDLAIQDYNKSLELNPKDAGVYYNRGKLLGFKGDYDQAIIDYNKAIELKPEYFEAYNNRGNAYASTGNYDQAISDLTKAIEMNPDYFPAYNNRGADYLKKGQYARAVDDLNKAIELNPGSAEEYCNRGIIFFYQKDYEKALADFNKAVELKGDYAEAHLNRGAIFSGKGDYAQAILAFNKAIEFNPKFAQAYSDRAIAYYNEKQYDKA
jgi:tetratricopeptide (TPR) repeat protein